MFSSSALPLGACKKDRNTYAEADVEDTERFICHWRDSSVAVSQRGTPQYTQHLTTTEQEAMLLVDDHYHTCKIASCPTAISVQIQDPTPQTWPQCSCWLEFTAPFTTPRRQHSFSQEQSASNVGTPAIPLCTQRESGSFLRDRIFAKQHAHLPSDKKQRWKGSVTNTPNYLPTPSLETQQLNQHACPKSTY